MDTPKPDGELKDDSKSNYPRALIGKYPNHWLYSSSTLNFDLTRPPPPDYTIPSPVSSVLLSTTTTDVTISPAKTALVIIDMQNFFLSTYLGRAADGAGNKAAQKLLDVGIPAARKAGIQIIWLNWGLTDEELEDMPPSTRRAFGFDSADKREDNGEPFPSFDAHGVNQAAVEHSFGYRDGTLEELTENGKPTRIYQGLGSDIGRVVVDDNKTVNAGRLLMRDTWNATLPPALNEAYKEGQALKTRPDVWIHKNRMSGLWGTGTACTEYLEKEGIRTLLFTGVNTDQCVGGSLQDAFSKGWDCILLRDACGTTSPMFASQCVEFNTARTWGFVADCDSLAEGVDAMIGAR